MGCASVTQCSEKQKGGNTGKTYKNRKKKQENATSVITTTICIDFHFGGKNSHARLETFQFFFFFNEGRNKERSIEEKIKRGAGTKQKERRVQREVGIGWGRTTFFSFDVSETACNA